RLPLAAARRSRRGEHRVGAKHKGLGPFGGAGYPAREHGPSHARLRRGGAVRAGWSMLLGALILAGCQTAAVPAVRDSADPAAMQRLQAALAKSMGRASVQLGPSDLTQSPVISVLPRPPGPLEGNSPAMPTMFRLELVDGACFVVREDGGARERVDGV